MDSEKKRERGKNYTEFEKQVLLDIINKSGYYHTIEDKKTDNIAVHRKNTVWDHITYTYNTAAITGTRSSAQLKELYSAIKRKVKKDIAQDNMEIYQTNGTAYKRRLDDTGEKYLELVYSNTDESKESIDDALLDSQPPLDVMIDQESDNEIKFDVTDNNLSVSSISSVSSTSSGSSVSSVSSISSVSSLSSCSSLSSLSLFKKSKRRRRENPEYRIEADKIKIEILKLKKRKEELKLEYKLAQIEFTQRRMEMRK